MNKTERFVEQVLDANNPEIDPCEIDRACLQRLKCLCKEHGTKGEMARKLFEITAEMLDLEG